VNADEIEAALEHAINALGLAKIALSKSAIPVFSEWDILRKTALDDTQRAGQGEDIAKRAFDLLADATARMARLEAGRDMDAQPRKTYSISQGER
jgi:hypothetical protein